MKQIKCISVGNLRCTVLLSCVLLVWMALFLLCCIENSNCYKVQRLLTGTVSLNSLAFGFLNKNKTISSGLWKQQWAASFQQQYVCELDGISLALLWNHLNLSFPYLRAILLHLFVKKKIHELVFRALKWTKYSFEIWQFAFSSAKQITPSIQLLASKGSFGKLAEKSYWTLQSMENMATKRLLCEMLLKCLFMSFANPDLGCW